jgi:hypothetical protein
VAIGESPHVRDQSGGTMIEPDAIQRRWARVVGFSYVFALVPAVFAELYISGRLVSDNAVLTAQNIIAHERLFRIGIASNLLVFATDVLLVTALYVVLERVNRRLALLATFFRLIETTILIVAALNDFSVLRLLSGASYLTTVSSTELAALARVSIGAHGSAYGVALLLFGFGSPVFCYLWLKSGYIPRPLAVFGLVASIWIGLCSFAFIVFPELTRVITIGYYGGPIFLFELTRRRFRRNPSGVVPCQRLNARWKPVGSEYPSKYAISVIESVASERYSSAARFRASSRRASKEDPVCANRRCSVRGAITSRRATASMLMSPAVI